MCLIFLFFILCINVLYGLLFLLLSDDNNYREYRSTFDVPISDLSLI